MDIIPFAQLPEVLATEHRNEYAYNLYLIAIQNIADLDSQHKLFQIQKAKANRMMSMIGNESDEDFLTWQETGSAASHQISILEERIQLAQKSKELLMKAIDELGGLDVVRNSALQSLDTKMHKLFGLNHAANGT